MIETNRLTLRALTNKDAEAVFQTLNYKQTAENIVFLSWPMTIEQAKQWCQRAEDGFRQNNEHIFLGSIKDNLEPIGCIGLHFHSDHKDTAETGYWIDEKHQGKGFAHEMLQAMINHAAQKHHISKLTATTSMDNDGSQALLKKVGFIENSQTKIKTSSGSVRTSRAFFLDMGKRR